MVAAYILGMHSCRPKTRAAILLAVWSGIAIETAGPIPQSFAAPVTIDEARAQAAGIRKLVGQHIVLYTDLASSPDVDSLPAVFDDAVGQWAQYFDVNVADARGWRVRAFLIGDRRAFDKLGVMPAGDDAFLHGLSVGADLWLYDQPSAYYRRHLLLHEGTHAYMAKFLGGCGPGWYMEGMAELFGTHRILDLKKEEVPLDNPNTMGAYDPLTGLTPSLETRIMPRSRDEVPMWGRIKLIRDAVAAGHVLDLAAVMSLDNRKQMSDESYAWCWAAAKYFDGQVRYRRRFRRLVKHVTDADFNGVMRREFGDDWPNIEEGWQAFVATLEYGYDFQRMAIEFRRGTPLEGKSRSVTITADRGWQSSGVWLEAGKTYHVSSSGRYQIAVEKTSDGEKPWPCEPGGVTIDYHDGRPLGMLLGAVVEARSGEQGAGSEGGKDGGRKTSAEATGFARPIAIGLGATITPAASGTLYLRVNDSAARLDDNRGGLTVTVED